MKPKKSSQKFHIIKFATLKNNSTQRFQALVREKFSLKMKEPLVKQERCNDARWFIFQHITSISQSGKTVDTGVNCLFVFFFSGLSIAWSRSSVSNDVFLLILWNSTITHYTYVPLPIPFVLTFKVFHFFSPEVWGGIGGTILASSFWVSGAPLTSARLEQVGAGWKTWRNTWDVITVPMYLDPSCWYIYIYLCSNETDIKERQDI